MKPNHQNNLNYLLLRKLLPIISSMLDDYKLWDTLDVDYYPPRVERLYTRIGNYRIYLHTIHMPDPGKKCLYHKHRWPAIFLQLNGQYEMGISYSEKELNPQEASKLPNLCTIQVQPGTYYEMMQTDALHYVKPITNICQSIMITEDLYPEAEIRKEALNIELHEILENRKMKLLKEFRENINRIC